MTKPKQTRTTKPVGIKSKELKIATGPHFSVSDMLRDLVGEEFADEFDNHLVETRISKILAVTRALQNQTQAEIAVKMGCSQAKVSKLERTPDRDYNFGDLVDYAHALGLDTDLIFTLAKADPVALIRGRLDSIKRQVAGLAEEVNNAQPNHEGIADYAIENVLKYVTLIEEALGKIPEKPGRSRPSVCVEVERDQAPGGIPRRLRGQSKKNMSTP